MFQRSILFATVLVLEVLHSLAQEEKIEPVELFHICIDPQIDENEPIKSPVILLHGLLANHKSYDGIDRLIANRTKRRVCSVDLRNHGDSPWSNRSDIATMTADIENFLKTRNIEKVNLIGESLGGKIAINYALNNPDRVDSVVVEDMHPNRLRHVIRSAIKVVLKLLHDIIESQPNDMNEDQARKWAKEKFDEDLDMMSAYQDFPDDVLKFFELRQINGKWQLKHNLDFMLENVDRLNELWTESKGLYTGPSLFIYGTESIFKVGEEKDIIFKLFPNARLLPFEGGHLIHEIHHEFTDVVVKFLNEIN